MTDLFKRFTGVAAVVTALAGIVFTVTFAIAVHNNKEWALRASAITLVVGSLASIPVLVALAEQLGAREPQFARVGLIVGVAASLGAAMHGAWDTAILEHPIAHPDVPSYTDARGFATFALSAVALAIFGALILRGTEIPRVVGQLALTAAALLVIVYFGRLIALDPKRPVIKWVALVSGLLVSPGFYLTYARSLMTDVGAPTRTR